jgi:hypothetical protein
MGEVDELFNCFDDDDEEKQTTVPIVLEADENAEGETSKE